MISWFDRCTAVAKTKSENVWRDLKERAQSSLVRTKFESCDAFWMEGMSMDDLAALSQANRPSNELFLDLASLLCNSEEEVALRAMALLDEARLEAASHKHMILERKAPSDPSKLDAIAFRPPDQLMRCRKLMDEHRKISTLGELAESAETFFTTELKAEFQYWKALLTESSSAMLALTSTGGELPDWLVGTRPDNRKIMELINDKNILKLGGVSRAVMRLRDDILAWSTTLTEETIMSAVEAGIEEGGFFRVAGDDIDWGRAS